MARRPLDEKDLEGVSGGTDRGYERSREETGGETQIGPVREGDPEVIRPPEPPDSEYEPLEPAE